MYYVSTVSACGVAWGCYQASQATTYFNIAKSQLITGLALKALSVGLDNQYNDELVQAAVCIIPLLPISKLALTLGPRPENISVSMQLERGQKAVSILLKSFFALTFPWIGYGLYHLTVVE